MTIIYLPYKLLYNFKRKQDEKNNFFDSYRTSD